jgi:hypothetical protein
MLSPTATAHMSSHTLIIENSFFYINLLGLPSLDETWVGNYAKKNTLSMKNSETVSPKTIYIVNEKKTDILGDIW